jgi:hypothetical protein
MEQEFEMPRDGSGVYSAPAGTTVTPGTTIESAKYNAFVADLVNDANLSIPLLRGGTGATTGAGAIANFGITSTIAELNILDGVTATAAEINKLDGVTSVTNDLNLVSGLAAAGLTATELGYVNGVTSSIQTQLDTRAPASPLHTIWLPAGAFTPTTTNGAASASQELATNDVMVTGYDFSASTDQKIQTMIAMPKSWDEGTVTAQVLWKSAATAGTGNVIWGVRALALGDDDAMDAAFGTAQTVTDAFIAANDLHITSTTAAITASGSPAEGDLLVVEVYRDADAGGDTYTQLARFIGLRLFYTANAGTDA